MKKSKRGRAIWTPRTDWYSSITSAVIPGIDDGPRDRYLVPFDQSQEPAAAKRSTWSKKKTSVFPGWFCRHHVAGSKDNKRLPRLRRAYFDMLPCTRVSEGDYHDVANHFFPNFDYMYGTSPHEQSAVLQRRFEYYPFSPERSLGSESLPGSGNSRDASPDKSREASPDKSPKNQGSLSPRQKTEVFSVDLLTAALPKRPESRKDKSTRIRASETELSAEDKDAPAKIRPSKGRKVKGLSLNDVESDDAELIVNPKFSSPKGAFGKQLSACAEGAEEDEQSTHEPVEMGTIFSKGATNESVASQDSMSYGLQRGSKGIKASSQDRSSRDIEELEADLNDQDEVTGASDSRRRDLSEEDVEIADLADILEESTSPKGLDIPKTQSEQNLHDALQKRESDFEKLRRKRLSVQGFHVGIEEQTEEEGLNSTERRESADFEEAVGANEEAAKSENETTQVIQKKSSQKLQKQKSKKMEEEQADTVEDGTPLNPLSQDAERIDKKRSSRKVMHSQQAYIDFHDWCTKKFGNMVRCWRHLDKDGNMSLSKVEFQNGLREFQYVGDSRTLWNILDRDRSGSISIFHFHPQSVLELSSLKRFLDEEFGGTKNAFVAMDKDRSGKLTAPEFRQALQAQGFKTEEPLTYIFKMLDLSKDSSITQAELGFLDKLVIPEYLEVQPDSEALKRFKEKILEKGKGNSLTAWRLLDKDASMRLSWAEFKSACEKVKMSGDAYPLTGIWRAMDSNLSGWVSFREFDDQWFKKLSRFLKWCGELAGSLQSAFDHLIKGLDKSEKHGQWITRVQFRKAVTNYGIDADEANELFDGLKAPGKIEGDETPLSYHEIRFLDKWGKNLDAELEEEEAWAAAMQMSLRTTSKDSRTLNRASYASQEREKDGKRSSVGGTSSRSLRMKRGSSQSFRHSSSFASTA